MFYILFEKPQYSGYTKYKDDTKVGLRELGNIQCSTYVEPIHKICISKLYCIFLHVVAGVGKLSSSSQRHI